ncbi:MAG: T9SS type A sorting domain-containing protein [Bacteroidales bacterium]|nr:T9SS type A sorting domain-containing protein [Bacteroidales bacterium]
MKSLKFIVLNLVFFLLVIMGFGQASMIVPPGTDVTLGTGTTLDIGGEKLLLQDDFSNVPSFLQYGTLSFSGGGKVYVEQYLTKDRWHMTASPVSNEVNEVYLWNYLAEFDEPSATWNYLNLPLDIPLNAGEGYFVWNYTTDPNGLWPQSPDSAVFDGVLNYQDIALTLSNTDASPQSGWNLLGNPFPVAIEWNLHTDWGLNNVDNTIYLYDSQSGNYVTWNGLTGTNPNGGFIAATQGLWVRAADTTGTPASLTIPASQRFHNNASYLKSGESHIPNQLLLKVDGKQWADKTLSGFIADATAGFDTKYDGAYFKAFDEVLSLYSVTHGNNYALNELPSIPEYPLVPLYFEPKSEGTYTLTASWLGSFPDDQPIYLEDKKDNVYHNFRERADYHFASGLSDGHNRFVIHFTEPAINGDYMDKVHIFSWQNTVFVDIPFEVDGEIFVFDITGRKILSNKAHTGRNEFSLSQANGNYIVKLHASKGVASEKVYIK